MTKPTPKKQLTERKPATRSTQTPPRKKRFHERVFETDSTYFLKLVVVALLGTLWLKLEQPLTWLGILITAIPLGIVLGFLLVRYLEPYQTDRKIWYAVLLVIGIVSYFLPAGIIV